MRDAATSVLVGIGRRMIDMAQILGLEHADTAVRVDPSQVGLPLATGTATGRGRRVPVPAEADQLTFVAVIGDILQPTHILFILVVALLVLGPKRLPEVGRSLGKGLRDFRGAMSGIEEHASSVFSEESTSTPTPNVDSVVQTVDPEPAEETVLVNTASTPAASTVTAPTVSRQASTLSASSAEPDPDDYAD